MKRPRIVILEHIDDAGIGQMEQFADVEWRKGLSREDYIKEAAQADAIIIKSVTQVDAEMLDKTPNLRVVARAGSGTENINLEAAAERDVQVITVPTGNVISAAEFAIAMMLMLVRRIHEAQQSIQANDFRRHLLTGHDLGALCVGLVGLGNVGKAVAERLQKFGCKIIAFDPGLTDAQGSGEYGVQMVSTLDELLTQANIVSLHVRLTQETDGMMGAEQFKKMPKGAVLVNTARGGVVDDQALLEAIESGHLAGAAVDVLTPEPPFDVAPGDMVYDHPFLGHPNIIVTPHMAASTDESQQRISIALAKELAAALA